MTYLPQMQLDTKEERHIFTFRGLKMAFTYRELNHLHALIENARSVYDGNYYREERVTCDLCHELGYIEAETDNGTEVQACQKCDFFGLVYLSDEDEKARELHAIEQNWKKHNDKIGE